MSADASTEQQIEALLAQMTLDEKVAMLHGATAFDGAGCERLGIPVVIGESIL